MALSALKPYLRGLVLIASFVALGYLFKAIGLYGLFDEAWIDRAIRGHGVSGDLLFLAVGAGLTAVGFPRQAVSFLGGYAFGLAYGSFLSLIAATGGCVLAFVYARLLGRSLVRRSRFSDAHPPPRCLPARQSHVHDAAAAPAAGRQQRRRQPRRRGLGRAPGALHRRQRDRLCSPDRDLRIARQRHPSRPGAAHRRLGGAVRGLRHARRLPVPALPPQPRARSGRCRRPRRRRNNPEERAP